jgi:hypothetical protein
MQVEAVNLARDGRPQYRLGDAVLKRNTRYGKAAFRAAANNEDCFAGTILHEYACRIDASSDDPQWPILRDIVAKKSANLGIELPAPDELVVHLRLGDSKGYRRPAANLVDYLADIIARSHPEISTATIVTAIHFGQTYIHKVGRKRIDCETSADRDRALDIVRLSAERGIRARLYSHADVDRDFCFLASARHLVLGNGHFSLCGAMISDATVFVPPWSRRGTYVDIDSLLESRPQATPSTELQRDRTPSSRSCSGAAPCPDAS